MSASEDAAVIHSGFCFKKGVYFMQWKRRFCVLRSDGEVRYYLEDSPTRPGHGDGHPIGIIDMKTATSVAAMPLDENSAHTRIGFFVACPDRTWEMAAANEAERDLWISTMRAAIKDPYVPCMVRHQGMVEKRGHLIRNWKRRWFVVTNQAMFYFSTELLAERFVRLAPFEFKKIIDNILELAQGALRRVACVQALPHL